MAFNGQGGRPGPPNPRIVAQQNPRIPQVRGAGLIQGVPGVMAGAGLMPTPPSAGLWPSMMSPAVNNPQLASVIQSMQSLPQFAAAAAFQARMQNMLAVARGAQMLQNIVRAPQFNVQQAQLAAQLAVVQSQLAAQQGQAVQAAQVAVSQGLQVGQVNPVQRSVTPGPVQNTQAGQQQLAYAQMQMLQSAQPGFGPGQPCQMTGSQGQTGRVTPMGQISVNPVVQGLSAQQQSQMVQQQLAAILPAVSSALEHSHQQAGTTGPSLSSQLSSLDAQPQQHSDGGQNRDRTRNLSPRRDAYRLPRRDANNRHNRDRSDSRRNDRNQSVPDNNYRGKKRSVMDDSPNKRKRDDVEQDRTGGRMRGGSQQPGRPRDLPARDSRRPAREEPRQGRNPEKRQRDQDTARPMDSASKDRPRDDPGGKADDDEEEEDIDIGEELWKRLGDNELDEVGLEETQDVLSKERAYLEFKAAKKRKQEEDEERSNSPVPHWIRSSPADIYFKRDRETNNMHSSKRMLDLEERFQRELVSMAERVRATKPRCDPPVRPHPIFSKHKHHHCHSEHCGSGAGGSADKSDSDSSSEESSDDEIELTWMDELNRKQEHPERLHRELWFNEKDEMNDGPLCRCSIKSRRSGIRHNIYPGEHEFPVCSKNSNNADKLYHYKITMSPHTNFLTKIPTIIEYDNHEYIFEGFSLFSHYKLDKIPVCKVIRFNIEYTIHWFEESIPDNFDVKSLDLFMDYLFYEILELVDLDWKPANPDHCARFHLMPRFVRGLADNGKEILSMNEVLLYLIRNCKPLLDEEDLPALVKLSKHEWQDFVDQIRGMIVTYPGMRPSSIRIDQLDREQMLMKDPPVVPGTKDASDTEDSDEEKTDTKDTSEVAMTVPAQAPEADVLQSSQQAQAIPADDEQDFKIKYPIIIHFGIRPAQLSYAGDPNYQKLWKQYVKFKHLLANKPKVTVEDKQKLLLKEGQLQEMRTKSDMKREVTVELSAEGFVKTGLRSDVCQHAMLLPVLVSHLRFHECLAVLERRISYQFKDRKLLQLALTHPSYRVNFGTNPDHARNSLSNCGIRQPEYGDSKIHHVNIRKRGINILINIMSRLGRKEETPSEINHYERLEFLGDAVVEFLSSIHLFFLFPHLEEGGLATYRAAIVQNQHLAFLAKKLKLQEFMLYAHGPDLCHESDLRHAMANCFEALMGALYLDDGIELADRVYGEVLFDDDAALLLTWMNLPLHPLQEDEPNGDRHWVASSPALHKLLKFEDTTGIVFNHIRLLARSFTMRNVGYNNLTFGHNQRLEFLGDTVLQLVASAYLFKHFPEHHEGHLSLLRSSLVNNRTQAVVCDDLGMTDYIIHAENRTLDQSGMKHKEKADLLEALIGALYVDKGLTACEVFCHVCFFPRLKLFIMNQDWNDPKSQLQQCCLTLRELDGGEPDIPCYKVIVATGPTNTRKYTVAVYFRGERLATGTGHSIQQAEMNAATNALRDKADLFPQLTHQKRFIEKKYRKKRWRDRPGFIGKGAEQKKDAAEATTEKDHDQSRNSKISGSQAQGRQNRDRRFGRLGQSRDRECSSDRDRRDAKREKVDSRRLTGKPDGRQGRDPSVMRRNRSFNEPDNSFGETDSRQDHSFTELEETGELDKRRDRRVTDLDKRRDRNFRDLDNRGERNFAEPDNRRDRTSSKPDSRRERNSTNPNSRRDRNFIEPDGRRDRNFIEHDSRRDRNFSEPDSRRNRNFGESDSRRDRIFTESDSRRDRDFSEPERRGRHIGEIDSTWDTETQSRQERKLGDLDRRGKSYTGQDNRRDREQNIREDRSRSYERGDRGLPRYSSRDRNRSHEASPRNRESRTAARE